MSATEKPAAASGVFTLGDMEVNRMGFGAMRITGDGIWGPPKDKAQAKKVLHKALDLGVNFIDTADSYGPYVSEELIAEALHPYPEGLVIGTKGGLTRSGPDRWNVDASPEHLEKALKGSLKRLKTDRIDLYQLHRFDRDVPMEETLGKLIELQEQGYINQLGLSEVNVEQCEKAREMTEFVSVQNKYNIAERKWDDVLEWCAGRNIAFLPWYPLAAGSLQNKTLREIAGKHNATVYQIALAWLLHRSATMIPIPGTGSPEHLQENTEAAEIELSEQEMKALNDLSV